MSVLVEKRQLLSNTDEVANLDVLRATAVSSVFFAHLYNFTHPGYSQTAWHFGQLGVLMFFVHTSLVLMLSLQRQERSGLPLFSTFYVRRWFRIYPLSMFFVTFAYLYCVTHAGDPNIPRWTPIDYLANLSLTQNLLRRGDMIGVLWTLPLEVQMYVMLPFLYLFLLKRQWTWVLVLLLASMPLVVVPLAVSNRLNIFEYVPCFLGGLLAWKLSQRYAPILPAYLWPLGIALVSLVWFQAENLENAVFQQVAYRWTFCVLLGASIPLFQPLGNTLFTRVAAVVAKYSYGIYLSHILILSLAFRTLAHQPRPVQWSIFVVLAAAVPVLVYHLLEAPMIRVGRRWSRPRQRSSQPEPATEVQLAS